jgi:hypothetical protein
VTGPVQVLVVGFDRLTLTGEVMAELDRLSEAGTARLLDVLLVERAEDGSLETLPFPEGAPEHLGRVAASLLGGAEGGEPSEGATWSLADAVPIGGTAAVALIEHVWAEPLREAIRRSGGTPLEEAWLHPEDVERLEGLLGPRPG